MTLEIRAKIDESRLNGSMECELPDKEFEFMVAGDKEAIHMWFEDVLIIRKGKRAELETLFNKTAEQLIEEQAELSRQRRAEKEAQPGQLRRPVHESEYHPKKKPGE